MEEWIPFHYVFLLLIFVITVIFWEIIMRWIIKNKSKVPGRVFEYLFFLFLFFATYTQTMALSLGGVVRIYLMVIFITNAIFCGYIYYVKKIFN